MISRIISTCTSKDFLTWKLTSKSLLDYCESKEKILIVPSKDFKLFKRYTPPDFNVVVENDVVSPNILKNKIDSGSYDRFAWFYQQILKIEFLKIGDDGDINLIWDADTVALRNFNCFQDNKIIYRFSNLHHQAYFDTIKFLLGIDKQTDKSFIAQVFPARVEWVRGMISLIEKKYNTDWYFSLLSIRNPSHKLFFSEYETLGNYIYANYYNEISFDIDNKWFREGGSFIDKISNYNYNHLNKKLIDYDYSAIESYDVLNAMNIIERSKYRLLTHMPSVYYRHIKCS